MNFVLLRTYRPPLRNYISSNMRGVTLHHKPMKWKARSKDRCQRRVKKRLKDQHNSRFLGTNPVAIIYSRLRLRRCRHFYPPPWDSLFPELTRGLGTRPVLGRWQTMQFSFLIDEKSRKAGISNIVWRNSRHSLEGRYYFYHFFQQKCINRASI